MASSRSPLQPLMSDAHARLLSRIRRRIGPLLRRSIEPEDILGQAALIACRRQERDLPSDACGFLAWMTLIAEREIQSTLRSYRHKERPRRRSGLPVFAMITHGYAIADERPDGIEGAATGSRDRLVYGLRAVSIDASGHQRMVFVMRELLQLHWGTAAFVTERSQEAARSLRRRMRGGRVLQSSERASSAGGTIASTNAWGSNGSSASSDSPVPM